NVVAQRLGLFGRYLAARLPARGLGRDREVAHLAIALEAIGHVRRRQQSARPRSNCYRRRSKSYRPLRRASRRLLGAATGMVCAVNAHNERMPMGPAIALRLRQHLTLTPQVQQALRLLQMSALEFAQEMEQALSANPFLEDKDNADTPAASSAAESAPEPEPAAEPEPNLADLEGRLPQES